MPQWDFLDFIAEQASNYPSFKLIMECEAVSLIEQAGKVSGVRAETPSGPIDILADLTIAADGRNSVVRAKARFEVQTIGAPMDVLWMRVAKERQESTEFLGRFGSGRILITIDRGEYWQCAYVIAKGQFEELKERGIEYLRSQMVALMPSLRSTIDDIESWDDCFLLTVAVDRLTRWWRTGLLCIGDAAHAMSPIGGVGINLAIQDAVATANELVPVLRSKTDVEAALQRVQERREFPAKVTQQFQVFVQNRIIGNVLSDSGDDSIPVPLRMVQAFPFLQRIPARVIGIGVRPEHIRTPEIT